MQPVTINGRTIRIDADTGAGALVDVVKALTSEPSVAASTRLTRMLKEPQLSSRSEKAFIKGKGPAMWAARAPVLVDIGWCCAGREGAEAVAHALDEDVSLVDEIGHRRHMGLVAQGRAALPAYGHEERERINGTQGVQFDDLVHQEKYVQLLEREVSLKTTLVKLDKERRMLLGEDRQNDDRPWKRLCHPDSSACESFTVPELLKEMGREAAEMDTFMRKAIEKDVYLEVFRNFQADVVPGPYRPRRYDSAAKTRVACAISKLVGPSVPCTQQRQGSLEKYLQRPGDAVAGTGVAEVCRP